MGKKLKVINVVKEEVINPVELIRELRILKLEISEKEKEVKKIKDKVDKYVDEKEKADARGNRYFETTDELGETLILKREARKSYKLDEELAKNLFRKKKVYDRVVTVVETEKIDEDEIENLIAEGIITMQELAKVTNEKVVYATKFVTTKDDVEEGNE